MDLLMKCAFAYQALMDYEYRFTLGRKGRLSEIILGFSETDFHHLAGLHKLKDLSIARANRALVFHQILTGKITYNTLVKSQFFPEILCRLNTLPDLDAIHSAKKVKTQSANRKGYSYFSQIKYPSPFSGQWVFTLTITPPRPAS